MPDLLQINGPHGPISSCGPACYNALFDSCACMCSGMNHAVGYEKALSNTLQFSKLLKQNQQDLILSPHSKKALNELSQTKMEF